VELSRKRSKELPWPDGLDSLVILDLQKGRVSAHDVIGAGPKRRQDGRRYNEEEAPFLPSVQNFKRRTLPEDPGNNNVGIENRLGFHFARRRTRAIADFRSVFLIRAFLASVRACRKPHYDYP